VNAEPASTFAPAPQLAGEGAPALLVAVLAAMGAALAVVSASMWLAPPPTPPEPVTIVVREPAPPPPPPIIVEVPVPTPAPPPEWAPVLAPPPPCFDPVTLMFAPASTAPLAGSDAGAARLRDWLDQHADARLLVEGYADSRGSEAKNLVLSFARAKSVAAILARNGVPTSRMTVRAAGATEAAADIDARDRRVVVGVEGLAACKSAVGATEHP
jgi:outer membrane protein OmpA-like peptidoglycan-associated protein